MKVKVFIYDTVYVENSLYEPDIALFVHILHKFGFTTQLVYATCFNVKSGTLQLTHHKLSQMHGFL